MAGPGMLGVRKGAWTKQEDELLKQFMENHGEGKWHQVPLRAGLNRCRKSCRLRWLNYLKPNIKRGNFADDEVDLIIRLHKLLGNRWSLIAGRLDGRTANDVKNYWNTYQRKRMASDIVAKRIKDESPNTKSNSVIVVRPRPRYFIKRSKCSESKETGSVEHTEPAQKTISMPNLPTTSPLLPVESVTDSTEIADWWKTLSGNYSMDNTEFGTTSPLLPVESVTDSTEITDWWKTLSGNYSMDNTEFGTTYSGVGLEEDIFTNFWIQDMDINDLLIDSTMSGIN